MAGCCTLNCGFDFGLKEWMDGCHNDPRIAASTFARPRFGVVGLADLRGLAALRDDRQSYTCVVQLD